MTESYKSIEDLNRYLDKVEKEDRICPVCGNWESMGSCEACLKYKKVPENNSDVHDGQRGAKKFKKFIDRAKGGEDLKKLSEEMYSQEK